MPRFSVYGSQGLRVFSTTGLPLNYLLLAIVLWLPFSRPVTGQTPPQPVPDPLELNLLTPDISLAGTEVVTAYTINQADMTVPSFWWADEQFGGKLLANWLAYTQKKRVDFVLNRQYWSFLDYLKRYAFVNQLGTVARDYGYNTRFFDETGAALATYTCNYQVQPPICKIELESSRQDGIRVRSNNGGNSN